MLIGYLDNPKKCGFKRLFCAALLVSYLKDNNNGSAVTTAHWSCWAARS